MRRNIDIDDKAINDIPEPKGPYPKEVDVEVALQSLYDQTEIRTFRGKLQWEGDLNDMRNAS
jgi:hypothetical protein